MKLLLQSAVTFLLSIQASAFAPVSRNGSGTVSSALEAAKEPNNHLADSMKAFGVAATIFAFNLAAPSNVEAQDFFGGSSILVAETIKTMDMSLPSSYDSISDVNKNIVEALRQEENLLATMPPLRYDPFTSIFDDAFDHSPFFQGNHLMSRRGWQPTGIESHEDDKNFVFQVDVPAGVNSDDLKMKLEDSHRGYTIIKLSGERKFQSEDGTSFESSSFERQFTIGPNVDKDKTTANLKDGVLTITIPKKEVKEALPTYIPITSGTAEPSE